MTIKIMIDPGHGGKETGAIAKDGTKEKDINLTVANFLLRKIQKNPEFDVKMTRYVDTDVPLTERCETANKYKADYFISIHHNASGSGADGFEVYHSVNGGKGKDLATAVAHQFSLTNNQRYVGVRESEKNKGHDYYTVIADTNMPAIITEYAFLDSKDYSAIDSVAEMELEALAIAIALCKHLGVAPKFLKEDITDDKLKSKIGRASCRERV